ncbi:MAG: terminase gpA endonuclease subunit [Brevinema sp.]
MPLLDNLKFCLEITKKSLSIPVPMNPADWCEQNKMVIPPGSKFENKLYNKKTLPYFEQPLTDIIDDNVKRITLIKSSQVGYTLWIMQALAYLCEYEKQNVLLAYPVAELAREFSNKKWDPFISSQSLLATNYLQSRSNVSTKRFGNRFITIKGVQTSHAFTQISYPVVFFDEMSNISPDSGSGDPIALAVGRTKAFGNKGLVIDGGVLLQEGGILEREFELSNQCYWNMPCPKCGTFQPFLFRDIDSEVYKYFRYELDKQGNYIKGTAYIQCVNEACECQFDEKIRIEMIHHPEAYWKETKTKDQGAMEGHNGYFFNALMSPLETMDKIATQHLLATKSNSALVRKAFTTDYEARSWKLSEFSIEHINQNVISSVYEIPEEVVFLTMGIDVQRGENNQNWLAYEIRGWGENYNSWGIEYHEIYGQINDVNTWINLLIRFYMPRYKNPNLSTVPLCCEIGCIDINGGFEQEVLSAIHRAYKIVIDHKVININMPPIFPTKGFTGVNLERPLMKYWTIYDTIKNDNPIVNEQWIKSTNVINTFLFKDILFEAMSHKTGFDRDKNRVYGFMRFVEWTNPSREYEFSYNKKYFNGLKSESKIFRLTKTKGWQESYEKNTKRNEPLDVMVLNFVAARLFRNSIPNNHPFFEQVCKLWYPDYE